MRFIGKIVLSLVVAFCLVGLTAPVSAQEQQSCDCVTCHSSNSSPVAGAYAYCGDTASVAAFAATLDKDGAKNGAVCQVVKHAGACPKIAKPAEYRAGSGPCLVAQSRDCSNTVSYDLNGMGCEARCCGENGCVVPGLNIFTSFVPYHEMNVSAVPDAERDRYFAAKALHQKHVVEGKEPAYEGPKFCEQQGLGTPAASDKCRKADRLSTITYGDRDVTITTKNSANAPAERKVDRGQLGEDATRFIPYGAR